MRFALLVGGMIAALLLLQYHLWFESGGIHDLLQLKKAIAQQNMENDKLRKRNEALLIQIEHLQNSDDATEARARNELGMIKKNETYYQVVK